MRAHGIVGLHRPRRRQGCTRRDPAATPFQDLVNRHFEASGPDRLWCGDITEHPTGEGNVYLCAVIDAWSRRVVGWSIADHLRAELVVDALDMARWRRKPPQAQTVMHTDHGCLGNTRAGCSATASATPGCWRRWARSVTRTTTRSSRASSAPSSSSCSTDAAGRPATNSPRRSSNTSKPGTTRSDGTARSAATRRSSSSISTPKSPRDRVCRRATPATLRSKPR